MKHRHKTVAEHDWDGEFDSTTNGRDLDRNPRTGVPLF